MVCHSPRLTWWCEHPTQVFLQGWKLNPASIIISWSVVQMWFVMLRSCSLKPFNSSIQNRVAWLKYVIYHFKLLRSEISDRWIAKESVTWCVYFEGMRLHEGVCMLFIGHKISLSLFDKDFHRLANNPEATILCLVLVLWEASSVGHMGSAVKCKWNPYFEIK